MSSIKEYLQINYLEWFNDYLTIEKYAEHRGITVDQAQTLIDLGKSVHESIVEEYKLLEA